MQSYGQPFMLSCCVCWEEDDRPRDDAAAAAAAAVAVRLGNLPCGHVVCATCLSHMRSSSCPVCRATFDRGAWRHIYGGCRAADATAATTAAKDLDSALDALRGFLQEHPQLYDLQQLRFEQRNKLHGELMEHVQQVGTLCPPTQHVRVVRLCGLPPRISAEMRTVLADAHAVFEARRGTAFEHLPLRVFNT